MTKFKPSHKLWAAIRGCDQSLLESNAMHPIAKTRRWPTANPVVQISVQFDNLLNKDHAFSNLWRIQ